MSDEALQFNDSEPTESIIAITYSYAARGMTELVARQTFLSEYGVNNTPAEQWQAQLPLMTTIYATQVLPFVEAEMEGRELEAVMTHPADTDATLRECYTFLNTYYDEH